MAIHKFTVGQKVAFPPDLARTSIPASHYRRATATRSWWGVAVPDQKATWTATPGWSGKPAQRLV